MNIILILLIVSVFLLLIIVTIKMSSEPYVDELDIDKLVSRGVGKCPKVKIKKRNDKVRSIK